MRSPLAYPLSRPVDGDAGGAADLQTDIMRFMAILALCLVAIFALVQSLPMAPEPVSRPAAPQAVAEPPAVPQEPEPTPQLVEPDPERVILTRSRWTPKFVPERRPTPEPVEIAEVEPAPPAPVPQPAAKPAPPAPVSQPTAEQEGFTLAFESDLALMRLVAAGRVGLYALSDAGAWRMTVSESRVSFWEASQPNSFHEMEAGTVPEGVVSSLSRSGGAGAGVQWGVTLPAAMRRELDSLMREHNGGNLKIQADGRITLGAES